MNSASRSILSVLTRPVSTSLSFLYPSILSRLSPSLHEEVVCVSVCVCVCDNVELSLCNIVTLTLEMC